MNARTIRTKLKAHKIDSKMEHLDRLRDADIDYSDIPPLSVDFWEKAEIIYPSHKIPVSLRIDEEVLKWYKHRKMRGYQTLMNAVLRSYMEADKRRPH